MVYWGCVVKYIWRRTSHNCLLILEVRHIFDHFLFCSPSEFSLLLEMLRLCYRVVPVPCLGHHIQLPSNAAKTHRGRVQNAGDPRSNAEKVGPRETTINNTQTKTRKTRLVPFSFFPCFPFVQFSCCGPLVTMSLGLGRTRKSQRAFKVNTKRTKKHTHKHMKRKKNISLFARFVPVPSVKDQEVSHRRPERGHRQ